MKIPQKTQHMQMLNPQTLQTFPNFVVSTGIMKYGEKLFTTKNPMLKAVKMDKRK